MTAPILVGLRVVLVALAAAAVLVESSGGGTLSRNLVVDAGLLAIVAASRWSHARAPDLPLPRGWAWRVLPPAAAALLAAAPTIALPYLSDDNFLLTLGDNFPTPFHAMLPDEGSIFFRPVAWGVWWFFGVFARDDATLARAVSTMLFAGASVLAVPALRRLSVPRGLAVAAATLYAASPLTLETVSWTCNLYSVLSALFTFAALATLPVRRGRPRRWIAPVTFALLAYLSKEDSFSLPLLAIVAGARWKPRRIVRALRLAAPFAAALAVALVARFALLGGIGGYTSLQGAGTPTLAARWLKGPLDALQQECPANYFLPKRFTGYEPPWRNRGTSLRLAPALLIAIGGASVVALRWAPRAIVALLCLLAPVASVIPIGADFIDARQMFLPSLGVTLLAASLLAGVPLGGARRWGAAAFSALRWGVVALYVALSLAVGRANLVAWARSGAIFRDAIEKTTPLLQAAPPGASVLLDGYPDSVYGALCFRNAFAYAFPRASGRKDLTLYVPGDGRARFDLWIEYRVRTQTARVVKELEPYRRLAVGESLRLDFRGASPDRDACWLRDVSSWNVDDGDWLLAARWIGAALVLPPVDVPPKHLVRVEISGDYKPEWFLATYRDGERWTRRRVPASGELQMPLGVTRLCFEAEVSLAEPRVFRGATISVAAP